MAIFKCKMCGGTLEIVDGNTVITCDYCGTKQTIPSFDNEKKINLFKRANEYRFRNQFDKASGIYETIISEFPNEAEAYWGLILCRYGIEYVDDPRTGEKIPTCHRTQYASIFDDLDYKNAIEKADVVARDIYKIEAERISLLQRGILEISLQEEPFDIFICYKETDEHGERTIDSVLAQDIYKELTNEGYRVFFSRITLEDKLGSQYEPYIFAALNSAKIMLHVTTNSDYSESVWVRNEWSRFLDFSKNGFKKILIPCYKNISAYDLPVEMQNFQGQDMSKIGSMQDLVRGINKILAKNSSNNRTVNNQVEINEEQELYESHLRKANVYLSKGMWADAIENFNIAKKLSKNCGRAYLGLMLAEAKEKNIDSLLKNKGSNCEELDALKLAESTADDLCKIQLEDIKKKIADATIMEAISEKKEYIKNLISSNRLKTAEEYIEKEVTYKEEMIQAYKECLYEIGKKNLDCASKMSDMHLLYTALSNFEKLGNYNDSESLITEVKKKKNAIIDQYDQECISKLSLTDYQEDSLASIECLTIELLRNKSTLKQLCYKYSDIVEKKYREIEEDGCKKVFSKAQSIIPLLTSREECIKLRSILNSFAALNRRQYFEPIIREINSKQKTLKKNVVKKVSIVFFICFMVIAIIGATFGIIYNAREKAKESQSNKLKAEQFKQGLVLMENGSFDEALNIFKTLGYKDSMVKARVCQGLSELELSIETKNVSHARRGITYIINAGESVSITYTSSTGIQISENNNEEVISEIYSSFPFQFYVPTVNNGYTFSKWYSTNVEYKENLTYLTMDSEWFKND